ncbi:MAG: diacylglycerol kinase family lipid kinase, partial [Chloroflexi bacterium]|nr:diacylglycerol kinase family lipid kinase [Chloroflexota bacterium]
VRAVLIYNPAAGQRDQRAAVEEAAEHLRSRGWIVTLRETQKPGDAQAYAREAVAAGLDAVIVAGGDGTINEAVNGLAYSEVALGVLPSGTANVWAQEIGLPVPRLLNPDPHPLLTCAAQLADGVVRAMDLGRASGRHFMLYGSIGYDAHIVQQMDSSPSAIALKQQLGGAAYYLMGFRAAWSFTGRRAVIVIDGTRLRRRIWSVMAANTQLYGGVIRIAADARADDGWLDIVVVRGHGLLATARHFASFIFRGLWADPQVEVYRARTAEVYTRKPLPVQVDGDTAGQTPVKFEVAPKAIRVLVPRGAPPRIFTD